MARAFHGFTAIMGPIVALPDRWIIKLRESRLFYDPDAAYFQGWSSWNPNRALWYDRDHAKSMSLLEAVDVACRWPPLWTEILPAT
jgi:hypothetical protein